MKKAKLFICHHPGGLLLYKNFTRILRKYDKNSKIILFKVNHPYFLKFNFSPFRKYFDEIIEFDFIDYKKNFFLGYWEIFKFQKKFKRVTINLLRSFERIDLFLETSAWLPINILLYNLSKEKNIKNIIRLTGSESSSTRVQMKTDKLKTLLCALYSLPFKAYRIKLLTTPGRTSSDFVYRDNVPGTEVQLVSPIAYKKKENTLPYPVILKNSLTVKKDMVIIFGDGNLYHSASEYLPDYQTYAQKLKTLFKAIENKYLDCKLYYKPHPGDRGQLMPGINPQRYKLFDNTTNAQTLLDIYHHKIKAVYTFSSSSITYSSFFGIPAYTFYRYLSNPAGIERLNSYFLSQNNKFIFHLSKLKEIGKIDNINPSISFDFNNFIESYKKILKI